MDLVAEADPDPQQCVAVPVCRGFTTHFLQENYFMLLVLAALLLMVGALKVFEVRWDRMSRGRMLASKVSQDCEAFSVALVRHLMPSTAVGKYRFRGMRPKRPDQRISLAFQNLGLDLPNGFRILDGVTGEFKAARMAAIMGPSGAGKTTFMNVLCGKATYGKMSGKVMVNGEEGETRSLKSVMGFVPQDDIVHQALTVRENIKYSMELRSPPGLSEERRVDIVEDVLAVMQIDSIQSSIVGGVEKRGISGGQRKRVSIGLELAACPTLLFLDEPTSGLDATSSLSIINSLKKMCELGMTIIVVLHQPRYSLYTLFDDMLLLGRGGRTVFAGPSERTKPYMEQLGFSLPPDENPADWFMDIISGEVSNEKIPDFEPKALFGLWELHGEDFKRRDETLSRALTQEEDMAALAHTVDQLWYAVDEKGSGSLDPEELKRVLVGCRVGDPGDDVLEQMKKRIGGTGPVHKVDFMKYLIGLSKNVATDKNVSDAPSPPLASWHALEGGIGAIVEEIAGGADDEGGAEDYVDVGQTLGTSRLTRPRKGFFAQCQWVLHRRMVQIFRSNSQRLIDVGLIVGCALFMGWLHRCKITVLAMQCTVNIMIFHLGLSLLSAVAATNLFTQDRALFWRESSTGLNVLAFATARMAVDTADVLLTGVIYTIVYYLVAQPPLPFWFFYWPCLMVSLVGSGWGYVVASLLPPKQAVLGAVTAILVFSGLLGNPLSVGEFVHGGMHEAFVSISLSVWSVPMTLLEAISRAKAENWCLHDAATTLTMAAPYEKLGLVRGVGAFNAGFVALSIMACLLRVAAYLGLRLAHRSQQV